LQVKNILTGSKMPPITIDGGNSIYEAMKKLIENKIGSLLITDGGSIPIGIITERDIFRLTFKNKGDIMELAVRECMTKEMIIGLPDDDIDYIAQVITQNRIRHIPIIDNDEKLCGIVSIGDIVKAKLDQAEVDVRYLKEYITGRPEPKS
jgi:CBS domain-containing protein